MLCRRVLRVLYAPSLVLLLVGVAHGQAGPNPEPMEGGAASLPTLTVEAERLDGLELTSSGIANYTVSAEDIGKLPAGSQSALSDVLAQLPGVAIDENQQIHIRNTEGPQFQYQVNGFLVPLDINTNPPFISMLNPLFIERLDLQLGALPARYGFATGGVVDIKTKDGCSASGGELELFGGQRETYSPSLVAGLCGARWSGFVSARAAWDDTAFSSATANPTPIHDHGREQQGLGTLTRQLGEASELSLLLAATRSDNQLPNAGGLSPAYTLAGVATAPPSTGIQSSLDFRDYLAMLMWKTRLGEDLTAQIGYSAHYISQRFLPDPVGELIYQGVASQSVHEDRDHTLEGTLEATRGAHTLTAGFYVGSYDVHNRVDSLVFPVDASGAQSSDEPVRRLTGSAAVNVVSSLYVSDLWRIAPRWSLEAGLRGESLTGYTHAHELTPRLNLLVRPSADTAVHAGVARFMQVPSLSGISPTTQPAYAGTSAQGPPGVSLPLIETDLEYDAGVVQNLARGLTVSIDSYYEQTHHYLDTGQFGVVPIFAPFNYGQGHMWGTELALRYKRDELSGYLNYTVGRNWQRGVATGQFNFDPTELTYIDTHSILLDHQPMHGVSAGLSYAWESYAVSSDALYSSGLAGGFADTATLPQLLQINLSAQKTWTVPNLLPLSLRLSVLNVLDRVNEIRSAQGIGIFQAAYAPRRTLYAALDVRF